MSTTPLRKNAIERQVLVRRLVYAEGGSLSARVRGIDKLTEFTGE
jgi:hypothetical protein